MAGHDTEGSATDRREEVRRITVVYYSDAPFYGGAEYYLYLLAGGLPRDRFDVHMIMHGRKALDDLGRPLADDGVPMFDPGEPRAPDPRHWISVYRYLREVGTDILHVNLPGPYDGQMGSIPIVGRMAGVRVVTTEHLPMERGNWRRALAKRLSRRVVDVTITMSDANIELLTGIHGIPRRSIRRVYNGVDVSKYAANGDASKARSALGLSDGERAIGVVGRLAPMKGHRFFLQAARRVHRKMPETRFFIVGDGWLRGSLEEMAADLGLRSAVRFLGYRKDVPDVLRALDVVVLSSTQEGMPFVLLEALAMAKPVVATDVYGLGELVKDGETGRLVPAENSDAIADAILALLDSPETGRALGARARQVVAGEFSLDGMLRQTAEIYESLAN